MNWDKISVSEGFIGFQKALFRVVINGTYLLPDCHEILTFESDMNILRFICYRCKEQIARCSIQALCKEKIDTGAAVIHKMLLFHKTCFLAGQVAGEIR